MGAPPPEHRDGADQQLDHAAKTTAMQAEQIAQSLLIALACPPEQLSRFGRFVSHDCLHDPLTEFLPDRGQ